MELIFKYGPRWAEHELHSLWDETYEDDPDAAALEDYSYIRDCAICNVMRMYKHLMRWYTPGERSTATLIRELYRIMLTREKAYLEDIDELIKNNDDPGYTLDDSILGYYPLMAAIRLLRYYFIVREKPYRSEKTWKRIDRCFQKAQDLKPTTGERTKDAPVVPLTEKQFVSGLLRHMDLHYIGQNDLKRKLCAAISQLIFHNERHVILMIGPTGSGKNYMLETIKSYEQLGIPVITTDSTQWTPTGYHGGEIRDMFHKVHNVLLDEEDADAAGNIDFADKAIVYIDEIDKVLDPAFGDNERNGDGSFYLRVQQELLTMLAGTETIHGVDTRKLLFILGGSFPRLEELQAKRKKNPLGFAPCANTGNEASLRDQLIELGTEREFMGRTTDIVMLNRLTRDELRRIMLDENIGTFCMTKRMYEAAGLRVELDEDTVEGILDRIEAEEAGARGVKNIINEFLDLKYYTDMLIGGHDTIHLHKGMLTGEPPHFRNNGGQGERK